MCMKNSIDRDRTETYKDFYWRMHDEKIASLMTRESGITFRGNCLDQDEMITPSLENKVVAFYHEFCIVLTILLNKACSIDL